MTKDGVLNAVADDQQLPVADHRHSAKRRFIMPGIFHLVKTLIFGDPVAGFPTLYLMMLLMGGIVLLFLGIMGQYLARIYLESKHRPMYIIKEKEPEHSENAPADDKINF